MEINVDGKGCNVTSARGQKKQRPDHSWVHLMFVRIPPRQEDANVEKFRHCSP